VTEIRKVKVCNLYLHEPVNKVKSINGLNDDEVEFGEEI
jgi:hypothetical protein